MSEGGGSGASWIGITGASGFIGSALVESLRLDGHAVRTIGRSAASDVRWDPLAGQLDARALEGAGAIVHLAASTLARRWTARGKRLILGSRVAGTRLIAEACARQKSPPSVLVSVSAIGFYGSRGDDWLDERASPGDDFPAEVCRAWEAAADPAHEAGIRVVHPRLGLVLGRQGGVLATMLPAFRLGVGGRFGTGRQWMSWITLADAVGALRLALRSGAVAGAINVTTPEPVTNATFVDTLGRVLGRPTLMTVPGFALRAMFGEMALGTVLASQRVRPAVLEREGFRFAYSTLTQALHAVLGGPVRTL